MRVGIHCNPDLAMPEELLHDCRVDILLQHERRTGVSHIVEPDARQTGFVSFLLEVALEV
jgi:hypothetical protein